MTFSDLLAPVAALLALPVGSRVPAPPAEGGYGSHPSILEVLRGLDEEPLPPSPDIERFGLLSFACRSAEGWDRAALSALVRVEGAVRSGGQPQGLEWAYGELSATADRLRQSSELLGRLARHEGLVRAILAASPEQLAAARAALSIEASATL